MLAGLPLQQRESQCRPAAVLQAHELRIVNDGVGRNGSRREAESLPRPDDGWGGAEAALSKLRAL